MQLKNDRFNYGLTTVRQKIQMVWNLKLRKITTPWYEQILIFFFHCDSIVSVLFVTADICYSFIPIYTLVFESVEGRGIDFRI